MPVSGGPSAALPLLDHGPIAAPPLPDCRPIAALPRLLSRLFGSLAGPYIVYWGAKAEY